jgi:hypothetical protein
MNKPRTLSDVLTEYASAQKLAKQDLDSVPATTRSGFANRKREAQDRLPKLRIEYLTMILRNSAGFFLEGNDAETKAFTSFAKANGAFEVDAAEIFEKLADKVMRSIGPRREFSITQIGLLDQALRELVEATGYKEKLKIPALRELRVVQTREHLVNYIRELVVGSNGGTPSRVAAQASLLDQTFKAKFADKRLIVVVRNATASDRAALAGLFTKMVTVDLDQAGEVTEKFVKDTVVEALTGRKPAPTPTTSSADSISNQESQSLSSAESQAPLTQTKNPNQQENQ